jgi:hypothetical protein
MKLISTLATVTIPLALFGACGGDDDPDTGGSPTSSAAGATFNLPPPGGEPFPIDPADFTIEIDNPYWPMEPGTRWTYSETDSDGTELQVVVTVTSETREIVNGATARVVRDTVTEDGLVIEDTFDWFAQDADGNIWYLGEDTAEFEDGEFSSNEGAWEAGLDGALAGVIMPGNPDVGMKYRQEYYAGEAEDKGEVLSLSETQEVTAGIYDNLLQTYDTSGIDPEALEHKYYAPGVGLVLSLGLNGGGREELVSMETISDEDALAAGTTPLGEAY